MTTQAADEFTLVSRQEAGNVFTYLFDSPYGKFEWRVDTSFLTSTMNAQGKIHLSYDGVLKIGASVGRFAVNGSRPWWGTLPYRWVEGSQQLIRDNRPFIEAASPFGDSRRVSKRTWEQVIGPLFMRAVESTLGDRPDPEERSAMQRHASALKQYERFKPKFEESQAELLDAIDALAKLREAKSEPARAAEA